jgi:hypothetical protein
MSNTAHAEVLPLRQDAVAKQRLGLDADAQLAGQEAAVVLEPWFYAACTELDDPAFRATLSLTEEKALLMLRDLWLEHLPNLLRLDDVYSETARKMADVLNTYNCHANFYTTLSVRLAAGLVEPLMAARRFRAGAGARLHRSVMRLFALDQQYVRAMLSAAPLIASSQAATDIQGTLTTLSVLSNAVSETAERLTQLSHEETPVQTLLNRVRDVLAAMGGGPKSPFLTAEVLEHAQKTKNDALRSHESVARLVDIAERTQNLLQLVYGATNETNMLALHALVEASRWTASQGEASALQRMAQEARDLAQRTAITTESVTHELRHFQGVAHEAMQDTERTRNGVMVLVQELEERFPQGAATLSAHPNALEIDAILFQLKALEQTSRDSASTSLLLSTMASGMCAQTQLLQNCWISDK